jgi:hypothetical protein
MFPKIKNGNNEQESNVDIDIKITNTPMDHKKKHKKNNSKYYPLFKLRIISRRYLTSRRTISMMNLIIRMISNSHRRLTRKFIYSL